MGKEVRQVANEFMYHATSSPDGRLLAGGTVRIGVWDAATGRELARLDQPNRVLALAFSPDGRRLAASAFNHPIRVWEVVTGTEMGRLASRDGFTLALAVSPDGRLVASGGLDRVVRLWDLASGKEVRKLEGHQGAVLAVAFSADGRRLISGSRDTTALIWDVASVLPAEAPARLEASELKELWVALASPEGAAALKAVRRLARAPEQSLAHIREHLGKPPAADPDRLARLIADLDAEDFSKREAASAELARLGKLAEAALKRALEDRPAAEVRWRAEGLLKKLNMGKVPPPDLQALRALEVLELIGTPEARQVIESLEKGAADRRVSEEAKAALIRLNQRRVMQGAGGG
jgi:hypothetical protein